MDLIGKDRENGSPRGKLRIYSEARTLEEVVSENEALLRNRNRSADEDDVMAHDDLSDRQRLINGLIANLIFRYVIGESKQERERE